jgi:hypothetical protein
MTLKILRIIDNAAKIRTVYLRDIRLDVKLYCLTLLLCVKFDNFPKTYSISSFFPLLTFDSAGAA